MNDLGVAEGGDIHWYECCWNGTTDVDRGFIYKNEDVCEKTRLFGLSMTVVNVKRI